MFDPEDLEKEISRQFTEETLRDFRALRVDMGTARQGMIRKIHERYRGNLQLMMRVVTKTLQGRQRSRDPRYLDMAERGFQVARRDIDEVERYFKKAHAHHLESLRRINRWVDEHDGSVLERAKGMGIIGQASVNRVVHGNLPYFALRGVLGVLRFTTYTLFRSSL